MSYALCLRVFVHGRRRKRRRRFPRCRLRGSGPGFGLPAGSSEVRRTHAGPPAAAPWQRHCVYLTTSPGWWMLQQSSHTALPKTFLLCGDLTGPSELQIFYPNLYISSQFLWTWTSGTTLTLGTNVAGDAASRSSKAPACISPFYAFTWVLGRPPSHRGDASSLFISQSEQLCISMSWLIWLQRCV